MQHYRCVKCFIPKTLSLRDSDTVSFFPHSTPFPKVITDDFLRHSITYIISLLQHHPPTTIPSLQDGDKTIAEIQQIATLLNRHLKSPLPDLQTPSNTSHSFTSSEPRVFQHKPHPSPRVHLSSTCNIVPKKHIDRSTVPLHTHSHTKHLWMKPSSATPLFILQFNSMNHTFLPHYDTNNIYNHHTGRKESLDTLLQGKDRLIWEISASNEFGR